jgi:amino acid transporter
MYTFTGYDASAHLSEETHDPARRAPWGIVTSVVVSAVAGYAYLVGLTLAIGNLGDLAKDDHAPLTILTEGLGAGWGRGGMGLAIFAMWFCGLASVTSASRTLWAFSRDDGLPFSAALRRVHPTFKTPYVAIAVAFAAPLVLVLLTSRFDDSYFNAMVSMATMGLYISYVVPVGLGVVARLRGKWHRMGPWNLRAFGLPIAVLAIGWGVFVLVVCSLPPDVLPSRMLGGMLLVLAIVYFAFVRQRFKGPAITLAKLEKSP